MEINIYLSIDKTQLTEGEKLFDPHFCQNNNFTVGKILIPIPPFPQYIVLLCGTILLDQMMKSYTQSVIKGSP